LADLQVETLPGLPARVQASLNPRLFMYEVTFMEGGEKMNFFVTEMTTRSIRFSKIDGNIEFSSLRLS
jgi:hypothetical protein